MSNDRALRVGVLVPENNTVVERELKRWLPAGSTVTIARVKRGKGLLDASMLPAYKASALELARQFAVNEIDVVGYGCTAASFILGRDEDASLGRELGEVTGKPVVTIAQAMLSVLTEANVRQAALVTPYAAAVNEQLKAFVRSAGIEVAAFDSFYAKDTDELGRIEADAVAAMARRTMTADADAMFIACAQLPTFAILESLEADFGKPVMSSVQSLARQLKAKAQARTA